MPDKYGMPTYEELIRERDQRVREDAQRNRANDEETMRIHRENEERLKRNREIQEERDKRRGRKPT